MVRFGPAVSCPLFCFVLDSAEFFELRSGEARCVQTILCTIHLSTLYMQVYAYNISAYNISVYNISAYTTSM